MSQMNFSMKEKCAQAVEALRLPESGPDYGMASEEDSRNIRQFNRVIERAVQAILRVRD